MKFYALPILCALLAAVAKVEAEEDANWTVVTMARGGAWGASTSPSLAEAIAASIRACKTMSIGGSDCGAEFRAIRRGWTLAFLCGDHRVLATGYSLQEAEAAIRFRIELKRANVHVMPPCKQVLAVNPAGATIENSSAQQSNNTE
jgi:hypothetical protein